MDEDEYMLDDDFGYLDMTEGDDVTEHLHGERSESFISNREIDNYNFPDWN